MIERPILFNSSMVRALLEGIKTQTRRVVKPAPGDVPGAMRHPDVAIFGALAHAAYGDGWRCPYGQPSDRLWVREAWARTRVAGNEMAVYREGDNRTDYGGPWKPGIHMFRRDCRILLEVIGVRVERLQDISADDCFAEGIKLRIETPAKTQYARLWEQINGAGSWAVNPWVWVVAFRRIRP